MEDVKTNKKTPLEGFFLWAEWWAWLDSNQRPRAYQAGALTKAELQAHSPHTNEIRG